MPRHFGRRFVPQSTIDRRVQAKDDRINAAIRAFRERTRTPSEIAALEPDAEARLKRIAHAVLDGPAAPDCPTCDGYAFEGHHCPNVDVDDRPDEGAGDRCSSACGFCGRCS